MAFFCFFLFVDLFVYLIQRTCGAEGIDCGFHFTSQSGKFSSPGYPKNYSPDLFCVWTVRVNGNNPEIKLTFSEFNLAPKNIVSGECLDYLTVYSGSSPRTDRLIGKYCGSNAPPSLLIKEAAVYINFISNEDEVTESGFLIRFSTSSSKSSITSSHATAGIVAAIFCGIVFLGVGAMRCIMTGACHHCQSEPAANRECIGTNETVSNYVMDSPPSYRTVMEHPERYPTPNMSPHISPISTPRASREQNEQDDDNDDDDDDGEPPPPYSRVIPERQASASIDLESNTAGTNPPCSRVERTIPVYQNSADNNDIVTIHSNLNLPDEERQIETNTRISEDEGNVRTSSNGRSHYNIASTGHPVLSANCECSSHTDGSVARNGINGLSSGSLSILDHNNEILDNYYDEPRNTVACNSSVIIADGHQTGCAPVTTGDSNNDNFTPIESTTTTNRSNSLEVWL